MLWKRHSTEAYSVLSSQICWTSGVMSMQRAQVGSDSGLTAIHFLGIQDDAPRRGAAM